MKNEKLKSRNGRAPRDSSPPVDIEERTFAFALRIIRLCQKLGERPGVARTLGNQVLRSGTAIGANIEEAQAAQSRADFISKTCIALKEARETRYWLRLLSESSLIRQHLLTDILTESDELARILGAIVRTSRLRNP